MSSACRVALLRVKNQQALLHSVYRVVVDIGENRMACVGFLATLSTNLERPLELERLTKQCSSPSWQP